MNDQVHDSELRALFEAQRRADASDAPDFAEMLVRARMQEATPAPRTIRSRRPWAAGLAAAAAIAALILVPRMNTGDDAFEQAVRAFETDPALGAWRSPTDALLHLPGDRLLSTVPGVGVESQ